MKKKSSQPQILVTGGAGYLGSVLVPMLLEAGYGVRVIDRLYFGHSSLYAVQNHPSLKITEEDILYQENIPDLFKNVHAVVHLASISNDPSCDLDPNLTIQTNFLATMALARRAQSEGVKRFVFMSSCSVYGASGSQMLDENSRTGPVTLYALSKLQAERELLRLLNPRFSITILRLSTLFGLSPRMRFDLAVNTMVKRALQNQNILVNGEGRQYRPFVHVKDAAAAIKLVLGENTKKVHGKIFNVGAENLNYTIKELAEDIKKHFPKTIVERVPFNNDIRSYRVRFNRFHQQCGYVPSMSVEDGIKEIKQAYQQGLWANMDDERFYNVLVMKKESKGPFITQSLASSPLWISKEALIQSK